MPQRRIHNSLRGNPFFRLINESGYSSNGKARQGRIIHRTYPSAITGSRDYMNYEYGTTVYAEVGANATADEHIQLIWLAGFVIGANFFGARTPNKPSYIGALNVYRLRPEVLDTCRHGPCLNFSRATEAAVRNLGARFDV